MKRHSGFTLLELLVVIAIISMLATVLLTQIGTASQAAQEFECQANLRNISAGLQNYKLAKKGKFPRGSGRKFLWQIWRQLEPSDKNRNMFFCPEVLKTAGDEMDDLLKVEPAEFWRHPEDIPRESMSYAARAAKYRRGMNKAGEALVADANDGYMNHKTGNTNVLYADFTVKTLLKTELVEAGIWPDDDPDFVLTTGESSPHKDLKKLSID